MPTDQQIVTALAKACEVDLNITFTTIGLLTHHDDAMAVQERLCGDAQTWERFKGHVAAQANTFNPPKDWLSHALSLSPSGRCRALFAALPDCGECHGRGERTTERSIRLCLDSASPMENEPCLSCDGTGKARKSG